MKAEPLRARIVDVLNRLADARRIRRRSMRRTCSTRRISITPSRAARRTTGVRARADAACASGAARRAVTTSASRARCRRCPGCPAPLKALCVVPFGMEEGTSAAIAGREFGLVGRRAGGVPVPQLDDSQERSARGASIEDWGDELEELGPLEVTLADAAPSGERRRSSR